MFLGRRLFCSLFRSQTRKIRFFHLIKDIFVFFWVPPLCLRNFFTPPFHSLSPSLSLSLSLYIYAVVLLSGPSLAFWGVIIWAKFVFYKTLFVKKHYKNRGFSTFFFWKKNCARKFEVLLSGPSWSFLRCSQLGPNNNTYLAQIITPQNAFFFQFFAFKNLLKYLFL